MEGQKLVIIINGKGGCGKDTICDVLARHYPVTNVSTITKVKEAARLIFGWNNGKEDRDRKFLSDLKDLWIDYNDGPFKYAYEEYKRFRDKSSTTYNKIMVIHVREPKEIEKLCDAIRTDDSDIPCKTLLITSPRTDNHRYGNHADDAVTDCFYDFIYHNSTSLEGLDKYFMNFFYTCIAPTWRESH